MPRAHLLHQDGVVRPAVGLGGLHLRAAVQHAAADQAQLLDLPVDARNLPAEGGKAAVDVVVLHVLADLLEGEADALHDEDGVQLVDLAGAVIAVSIVRVHIRGPEQADLVVKDQRLLGDVLVPGNLADRKIIFHAEAPLTI